MKIKILALVLSALMLLSVFAGCKKTSDPATDTTPTTEAPAGNNNTPVGKTSYADLTPVDMGGEEITILTRSSASTNLWKPIDWIGTKDDTDEIPAAVYKRNTRVEEDYKCVIKHVEDENYLPEAQAAFIGDTEDYDVIVMPVMQQLGTMAAAGYNTDFASLSTVDLNDAWWDAKTNDSLSLINHYYSLCGDIDITDNRATWCVFFNKTMETDYLLDSHYSAVDNGGWTMEKMFANAAEVDNEDLGLHGIGTELFAYSAFLMSSGVTCFAKDENDIPLNRMNNREVLEAVNNIYNFVKQQDLTLYGDLADQYPALNGVGFGQLYRTFRNASMLYCIGTLSNAVDPQISDATFSYGILPLPKASETQSGYVSTFQGSNGTGVAILSNHNNKENIGTILSAMSAASMDTLTPAFYDTTLYGRKVPDPESYDTLKMIIENREVDLGIVLSYQVRDILNDTFKDLSDFTFSSNRSTYMQNLEKNLDRIVTAIQSDFATSGVPEAEA